MSINATSWAWGLEMKPNTKFVLLAIADRADNDGRAWPSIARLARDTGLDARSVYRHIKTLSDEGFITIMPDNGRGNTYQLNLTATPLTNCHGLEGKTPDSSVTPDKLSPLTVVSQTPDSSVRGPLTKTTNASIYEPSMNHHEPSKNKRARKTRSPKPDKKAFGEFGNVRLTEQEHSSLVEKFGSDKTGRMIAKLDSYVGSTGKTYKSHYLTMFSWVEKSVNEDLARARASPVGQLRPRTFQEQKRADDREITRIALAGRGVDIDALDQLSCDGIVNIR